MITRTVPEPHLCRFYVYADGPVGTVWRCPECGTCWRRERPGFFYRPGGWYVLSGLRLWWWKRKQRKRGEKA